MTDSVEGVAGTGKRIEPATCPRALAHVAHTSPHPHHRLHWNYTGGAVIAQNAALHEELATIQLYLSYSHCLLVLGTGGGHGAECGAVRGAASHSIPSN